MTVLVALLGAAGMLTFEPAGEVEGGFTSYTDALWWTAMLLTTMGSEFWPRTPEGRLLCLLLAAPAPRISPRSTTRSGRCARRCAALVECAEAPLAASGFVGLAHAAWKPDRVRLGDEPGRLAKGVLKRALTGALSRPTFLERERP